MTIKEHERRYAVSIAITTVVTMGGLSGLLLFVWWAGWSGAIGILTAAGMFLAWFYKGKRPDLVPRKCPREEGRSADA